MTACSRLSMLILWLLLVAVCGQAEANEMYFRHYNNKDGLSHNTVYHSIQDRKGFLWFGTDDGLNRFDGHTFKAYRYNSNQTNSLLNDRIISLFEDSSGRLWVCTNYGVCYMDSNSDLFYPFYLTSSGNTPEYFTSINEDSNQHLWMHEYNRIVRFSPADNNFKIYPADSYFHPANLVMTAGGQPLFSSYYDLYYYKPDTDTFLHIPILTETEKQEQTHITAICEVADAGVLIGTDKKGLKLYQSNSQQVETIIPDIHIRAITSYNSNTFWIASESGVYIYNIINRQITHLTKSLTNEYGIVDNAVYCITKDSEGGIWLGSFFGGIGYLPPEYTPFNRYIGGKTHPEMLGNAVREIFPDDYGNLWLGTEDNGINRYNLQTGKITNFSLNNVSHPLSATNIHGLFPDGDKLWIGTFNKGIDLLELPSGKIIKKYTQANTNNGLRTDFVLCFHPINEQELIVGTGSGTSLFNRQTGKFSRWQNINFLTRQVYKDKKGRIWAVTSNGLFCYHPETDNLKHYTSNINIRQSLGSNTITSVYEDHKNRIWVTTTNGLSLYNEETDQFNRITAENGFPSNILYRILEDDEQNFWISTANGLVKFNPDTHAMQVFTYTNGLHETQFNFCSSYKAPDGTMYFGTINGMISFNPKDFKTDTYSPPLYITTIQLPGEKILPGNTIDKLSLPYDKSTFTLSYIALSYAAPDAIQYAYMLEGVDKDWNYMNQNKDVTFANLSPGKYTFKVRSTNSSGIWQNNEIQFPITIIPPFWATIWAYIIYCLGALSLAVLFYYYKKSKFEEQHRQNREKFETQKEKELYNAKIQFFTFITHEIRTPLTLIKAPLEKILTSGDGTPATKKNLLTIEKNTQRLIDLSNQLLDFRKTEAKGFKLNFVHTDVTEWIEDMILRFRPAMEKDGKEVSINTPDEHLSAYIDREAFSKIVSNMLTNAIKYSDSYIGVELRLPEGNDPAFSLIITNDGMLITEKNAEKIFTPFYRVKETENMQGSGIGLSLARSLAELHKGTLVYQPTQTGLNRFILTLPVIQEDSYLIGEKTQKQANGNQPVIHSDLPVILIVEDQADMREYIAHELAESYQILEADNGKSALNILNERAVRLIISDVMMPIMDGFELCNEVKNNVNLSHIPFIILTAQHNLQSRLKGLNTGADAYIEKPFSIDLLTSQISNLLKSRELLNRAYLEKPLAPTQSLAVSPLDEIFLNGLNEYLEENLTNSDLSVENIASGMNMSTSSLYRKVKGLSGMSPVDFIRVFRLKQAVKLMEAGENRISEIAFKVGFSSPAYFSTSFQKQYGKSPSEYMKNRK